MKDEREKINEQVKIMEAEQEERIIGYFIEEAKDHLDTIEQGLIYMSNTIADPEMIDEVFRAAHSVKGGAGINSIQKIAHKLEDYLKIMEKCQELVDKKLEYLLFQVFDSLQELLDNMQGPLGLTEEKASEIMLAVEPVLVSIDNHLGKKISAINSRTRQKRLRYNRCLVGRCRPS